MGRSYDCIRSDLNSPAGNDAAISLQQSLSSLGTCTQPVCHSSSNKENVYRKRAREVKENAENGTPRKRSKPNFEVSDDEVCSAIIVEDDEGFFSTVVRPAQLAATHARMKHEEMQASANKANEELKTLKLMQEWHNKDVNKTEGALYDLVQKKKEEIALIEQKYEPHIKNKEEDVAQAAFQADKFMKLAATEQVEDGALMNLVHTTYDELVLTRRTNIRREFITMVGQGRNVDHVAKKLSVFSTELTTIFDQKITKPEDLRSAFGLNN